MASLYPPILSSTQLAVPSREMFDSDSKFVEIYFTMPAYNSVEAIRNGHCQLSIRYKNTGDSALNPDYSPNDGSVYFFSGSNGINEETGKQDRAYLEEVDLETRVWRLVFDSSILLEQKISSESDTILNGFDPDREYSVQIRFGDNPIRNNEQAVIPDFYNYKSDYASWWNTQVNKNLIGEWSNTVTIYAYGKMVVEAEINYDDFVPQIIIHYSSKYNDPPIRANLDCLFMIDEEQHNIQKYAELGGLFKKIVSDSTSGTTMYRWKAVWRPYIFTYNLTAIKECTITTGHGATIGLSVPTSGYTVVNSYGNYLGKTGSNMVIALTGYMEDVQLEGEEIDDGLIVKDIVSPDPYIGMQFKTYRINTVTWEAIQIADFNFSNIVADEGKYKYRIRDYGVEHGEKFDYVTIAYEKNSKGMFGAGRLLYNIKDLTGIDTENESENNYHGRLTNM